MKETYWFFGTSTTVLIVILLIFGFEGLRPEAVSDFNVYDTYYVIPTLQPIVLITTLIFFIIYLARMLGRNFKNQTANLIFMISNIALILILTLLISLINSLRVIPGTTEYPTSTGGIVEKAGNFWNSLYYIFLSIQMILIILLTISGIKSGLNYNRNEK